MSEESILDDRKTRVLRAIITEYVAKAEPVGSKRVLEVARLDVSAATVRNDMAALEDAGLIQQPHTSAGRVPTDKGYRHMVDTLARAERARGDDVDPRHRALITELIGSAHDLDDLLVRATQALAELTHLVALVVTPAIDASACKLLEVVSLGQQNLLVILVSDTGHVAKRHVELDRPVTEAELDRVRSVLGEHVRGRRMAEVRQAIGDLAPKAPDDLRHVLASLAEGIGDDVSAEAVQQVLVGGSSSLVSDRSFDRDQLEKVLGLLEERATVGRVLKQRSAGAAEPAPSVTIGGEHDVEDLTPTSLVGKQYDIGAIGSLGILGPTRMDYAKVLSTVRAVADELERALAAIDDDAGRGGPPDPDGET